MLKLVSLILLSSCAYTADSAKILFATQFPSVSHQIVFQPIWRELSLRGHQVHVITTDPLRDPSLKNLTEIDVSSLYDVMLNRFPQDALKYILKKPDVLTIFIKDIFLSKAFNGLGEYIFNHPNVQKFLSEEHEFDVVIAEWLFPTMAAFAAKYNAPLIGITSLGAPVVALDAIGNPSHPIIAPDHNLPITRDMTFKERIISALYSVYSRLHYHLVVLPREDATVKKYLGADLPYIGDIERNISLLLLNRNPVFHRIFPTVSNVIEFGGMRLNRTKQKLDKELQIFLDKSKQGFVYFSLGSNMRSIFLPDDIRSAIFEALSNIPFNVLWKWEDEVKFPGKAENIMYRKWLPQNEVLAHPNIKVFVTQGGLQSVEEAINFHVPVIGIPFHADQTANTDTCVKYGIGLSLDLEDLTTDKLKSYILEVATNSSYKENVVHLEKLLHDKPTDGLKRAVWWIEYVIRHRGAKHLKSPVLDISWCHYLMLDVVGTVLLVLILLLFITYKIIKLFIKLICKIFSRHTRIDTLDKKSQ